MYYYKLGGEPLGATKLTADDIQGLKLDWVTSRSSLDIAEAEGIRLVQQKYKTRPPRLDAVLDDMFIRKLHKEMFGEVWDWAGKYRTKDLNIGVDFQRVAPEVRDLVADAKYWFETVNGTETDKDVIRLHHRLVLIHPFINGNGRLGREYANLISGCLGRPELNWRGLPNEEVRATRMRYIAGMRSADDDQFEMLFNMLLPRD